MAFKGLEKSILAAQRTLNDRFKKVVFYQWRKLKGGKQVVVNGQVGKKISPYKKKTKPPTIKNKTVLYFLVSICCAVQSKSKKATVGCPGLLCFEKYQVKLNNEEQGFHKVVYVWHTCKCM